VRVPDPVIIRRSERRRVIAARTIVKLDEKMWHATPKNYAMKILYSSGYADRRNQFAGHGPMHSHSIEDFRHEHVFLGEAHERNERKVWIVIAICAAMMVAEIVGGLLFGSVALIADGLHMSTHAGALLIAALSYTLRGDTRATTAWLLERGSWAILRRSRVPSRWR
jgi:hypothetical protein